jgi:hypothetical protein
MERLLPSNWCLPLKKQLYQLLFLFLHSKFPTSKAHENTLASHHL